MVGVAGKSKGEFTALQFCGNCLPFAEQSQPVIHVVAARSSATRDVLRVSDVRRVTMNVRAISESEFG